MTCHECVRRLSLDPGDNLPAGLAEHLAACPSCARLLNFRPPQEPLPPDRLDKIKSIILQDLTPVSPLPPPGTLLLHLCGLFAAVLVCGALLMGNRGWDRLPLLARVCLLAPSLAGIYLLGRALVRQIVPGTRTVTNPAMWPVAVVTALIAGAMLALDLHDERRFFTVGLRCFSIGLAYTAAAAGAAWLVVRRGSIDTPLLTFPTIGMLAGFVGVAGAALRCPNLNEAHCLTWHVTLVLAGALGGVLRHLAGRQRFFSRRP